MRDAADRTRLQAFMARLGERVRSQGTVYFTGGATALLHGWRAATVDLDIKADPEPAGLFEAIAELKNELDVNVELASPDDFIPPLPDWRERSSLIGQYGQVTFRHYDPYAQVLAKLQRGHDRDLRDAAAFVGDGLVECTRLLALFEAIEPHLVRYPAIDGPSFRKAVEQFCAGLRQAGTA